MNVRVSLLFAVLLLTAFALRPALAQSEFSKAQSGPLVGAPRGRTAAPAPPPGLPGTLLGGDRVAPAEKGQGDMPPTEALFDAINRGDIISARDAVNRGADIGARNVLGLTPIDESIDLGRNDITFLLLSLRPAGTSEPVSPVVKPATRPGQNPARVAAAPAPAPVPATRPAPAPKPVAAPIPRQQAETRVPSSPGTPNPQAGFLGFGG